jgi:sigma-B regulation protein RsbU (phosphoserine phosphatase)
MRMLIAEDEPVSRCLLEDLLVDWGHEVVAAPDGLTAWALLRSDRAPKVALLDWQMPGMDGVEVCRKVRTLPSAQPLYVIFLTARQDKASIVSALEAGANDFISKPFDADELRARVNVGARMVELQQNLAERIRQLEESQAHVKRLQGILPICAYCKKVRNDQNYWQQVESYLADKADVLFSHGICPECLDKALDQAREELGIAYPEQGVRS